MTDKERTEYSGGSMIRLVGSGESVPIDDAILEWMLLEQLRKSSPMVFNRLVDRVVGKVEASHSSPVTDKLVRKHFDNPLVVKLIEAWLASKQTHRNVDSPFDDSIPEDMALLVERKKITEERLLRLFDIVGRSAAK